MLILIQCESLLMSMAPTTEESKRDFINEGVNTFQKIVHICRVFEFRMNTHSKPNGDLDYVEFGDPSLWLHHKGGYYTGQRIKSGMISIVWGQIFTNFFNGIVGNPDPTDVEQFTHSRTEPR